MSVPAYKRKESKMEFMSCAISLVKLSVTYGEKISRRHKLFGAVRPYELSVQVLELCIKANDLNVKSDFQDRQKCWDEILTLLNCISTHLTILATYVTNIEYRQWEMWTNKLFELRKLIIGIKKSDKERQ